MRPLTKELWKCATLDNMPGLACRVDFGIESPDEVQKFGALQWAIKREQVSITELDSALGDGPLLTEIVNRGNNPYACEIKTAWDGLSEDDEDEDEDDN